MDLTPRRRQLGSLVRGVQARLGHARGDFEGLAHASRAG